MLTQSEIDNTVVEAVTQSEGDTRTRVSRPELAAVVSRLGANVDTCHLEPCLTHSFGEGDGQAALVKLNRRTIPQCKSLTVETEI